MFEKIEFVFFRNVMQNEICVYICSYLQRRREENIYCVDTQTASSSSSLIYIFLGFGFLVQSSLTIWRRPPLSISYILFFIPLSVVVVGVVSGVYMGACKSNREWGEKINIYMRESPYRLPFKKEKGRKKACWAQEKMKPHTWTHETWRQMISLALISLSFLAQGRKVK